MAEYEYQCEKCDYVLTVKMSMKEYSSKLKYDCPDCGTQVKRIITAPAIHFGAGFFKDGYESAKNVKKSKTDDGE